MTDFWIAAGALLLVLLVLAAVPALSTWLPALMSTR